MNDHILFSIIIWSEHRQIAAEERTFVSYNQPFFLRVNHQGSAVNFASNREPRLEVIDGDVSRVEFWQVGANKLGNLQNDALISYLANGGSQLLTRLNVVVAQELLFDVALSHTDVDQLINVVETKHPTFNLFTDLKGLEHFLKVTIDQFRGLQSKKLTK